MHPQRLYRPLDSQVDKRNPVGVFCPPPAAHPPSFHREICPAAPLPCAFTPQTKPDAPQTHPFHFPLTARPSNAPPATSSAPLLLSLPLLHSLPAVPCLPPCATSPAAPAFPFPSRSPSPLAPCSTPPALRIRLQTCASVSHLLLTLSLSPGEPSASVRRADLRAPKAPPPFALRSAFAQPACFYYALFLACCI